MVDLLGGNQKPSTSTNGTTPSGTSPPKLRTRDPTLNYVYLDKNGRNVEPVRTSSPKPTIESEANQTPKESKAKKSTPTMKLNEKTKECDKLTQKILQLETKVTQLEQQVAQKPTKEIGTDKDREQLQTKITQQDLKITQMEHQMQTHKSTRAKREQTLIDRTDEKDALIKNKDKEIAQLERTNTSNKTKQADLEEQINQLTNQCVKAEDKMEKLKDHCAYADDKIEKLTEHNQKITTKNSELETFNNDLVNNIAQNETIEMEQHIPKQNILVIGDSNIHKSKEQLDRNRFKWTVTNNIYTTRELRDALEDQELQEEIRKHDAVVIAQGTNDLRREDDDGQKIYRNLIKAAEDIHGMTAKPVYINQVPPMNIPGRGDLNVNAVLLNNRIAKTKIEGVHPILTSENYKELTNEQILGKPGRTKNEDGYHLVKKGSEALAEAMAKALKTRPTPHKQEKTKKEETNNTTKTTTVAMEHRSRIIGRSGTNVNQLQRKYRVKIGTDTMDDGKCKITIRGHEDGTEAALKEIMQTIKDAEEPKEKPICRYYLENRCDYEKNCRFPHPPKETLKETLKRKRPTPEHTETHRRTKESRTEDSKRTTDSRQSPARRRSPARPHSEAQNRSPARRQPPTNRRSPPRRRSPDRSPDRRRSPERERPTTRRHSPARPQPREQQRSLERQRHTDTRRGDNRQDKKQKPMISVLE